VTPAISGITLQARNQAWQPVARHDADCLDSLLDQKSLRASAGMMRDVRYTGVQAARSV
jgi:hypothetical protein